MRCCTPITLLLAGFLLCGIGAANAGTAEVPEGKLFVICIGVNNFFDVRMSGLKFAVADAKSSYATLTTEGSRYASVSGQMLLDEQATKSGIVAAMLNVASKAKAEDTLIFYFSGRGIHTSAYSLIPADGSESGSSLISMPLLRELSSEIAARNQLFILDTCTAPETFRAFVPTATDQDPVVRNLLNRNIAIIAPVGIEYDDPNLGHGPLTAALLKAMAGDADLRNDGHITVRELEAYLPYGTMKLNSETQATVYDQGEDFYVASVPAATHAPDRQIEQVNPDPVPPPPPPVTMGKDVAFLFATDDYESSKLPKLNNPVADAQALAAVLHDKYGFETEVEPGLNREEVYTKLAEYRKALHENDQLFVFFAGHGLYRKNDGLGYVASKDSKPDDPDPDQAGIDYFKLRTILNQFPCKHILIALDVCFGGTLDPRIADEPDSDAVLSIPGLTTAAFTTDRRQDFFRLASDLDSPLYGTVSDQEYALRSMQHKSRLFVASGRKESISDGEPGQHSPFAAALISVLDDHAQHHTLLTWNGLQDALHHFRRKPYTDPLGSDPDPDFVLLPK